LSLLKTLTLPTFSKLAATLPKKIFGSQNHFWQLAQAELVEFIPDTKSLAAKTNFGRITKDLWHYLLPTLILIFFLPSILFCNVSRSNSTRDNTPAPHTTQQKMAARSSRDVRAAAAGRRRRRQGRGAAASLCSVCVGAGPLTRWRQPKTTIDARSPAAAPAGGGSGAGSGR
jgi:hypothetical protein